MKKEKIIYCKDIAKNVRMKAKKEVDLIDDKITLQVISVGDDPATASYIRGKVKACKEVGINCVDTNYGADSITQDELKQIIIDLNNDPNVHGILIQLPLPKGFCSDELINLISPEKDVDGLTDLSIGRLYSGRKDPLKPCTPLGIMEVIKSVNYNLEGKKAVVIGRSSLCGQPAAKLLQDQNATVTIAHRTTKNLKRICREADIIVAAIGKAKFINSDYVKEGAFLIDVGINRVDGSLCGDIDFDDVLDKVSYITPVPGGAGVMTVAMLIMNTIGAYKLQHR